MQPITGTHEYVQDQPVAPTNQQEPGLRGQMAGAKFHLAWGREMPRKDLWKLAAGAPPPWHIKVASMRLW